jgi:hypothetical protein
MRTIALLTLGIAALSLASAAAAQTAIERLGVDPDRAIIDVREVLSGGPPPQGIPALGFAGLARVADPSPAPRFVEQADATWLGAREPVILMRLGGEARIYPLQILTWHEIANDTLGGVPVAVTFCPLCNSALAFDRRVPLSADEADALRARGAGDRLVELPLELQAAAGGKDEAALVTFGVSGLLYLSNLLMFDETTRTLWSQLVGEGMVGELAGARLLRYPAQIVSFAEAAAAEPDALVLSRETGFVRTYGRNPYVGYDDVDSPAFLFSGVLDGRLPPKARVVTLDRPAGAVAYPFDRLETDRVLHDVVHGEPIVLFWQAGTASALGAPSIADAADVGAVGVFTPAAEGRTLTFEATDDGFVDLETGSRWDVTGRARSGPLEGTLLESVAHDNTLWFAWAAFRPETEVRGAP